MDWNELRDTVVEDFREAFIDGELEPYPEDRAHEYADGGVPVYNGTLMEVVASDADLYLRDGPGYPGTAGDSIIGHAQAVVYDALVEALHDELRELQDQHQEWLDQRAELEDDIEMAEETGDAAALDEFRDRLERATFREWLDNGEDIETI